MTVRFVCDCCLCEVTVPELVDEVIAPPDGWRRIQTVIDEFCNGGAFSTEVSEYAHSCDECNANMSHKEHAEAEHARRLEEMRQ